jgi:hypothetical protein
MTRKRAILYAALALAVPLPALALDRGDGAASLDVQASLGSCGIADAAISCRIDVAFSPIPDAEYYTASVTAPDGSVLELGTIAGEGGGASTSVPFSGNGEYVVSVTAWGYDERGRPDVVESERAGTARGAGDQGATEPAPAPAEPEVAPAPEEEPPPAAEPPTPPGIEQPPCPEPEEPALDPAEPPAAESEPAPAREAKTGPATEPECEPQEEPEPPPVP